ncbi:hypothetical protein [Halobellus ordinarius]|uniref:hypothetical protein n=1 Tax=Halobellus ordinarius TaxID=3075120 RepID=UPI002880745A|nr:hypothetical protein [Halobellus sp. ZY16]
MNRSRALTIAVVLAVVGMAAFPMAAGAATDVAVDIEQSPETGAALVTVTENGSAVENATVNVSSESAYAGNGSYDTNENGTVALPNPDETVTVQVNVTANDTTESTQVELVPQSDSVDVSAAQQDDGTATVTVTQYDDAVENTTVNVSSDAAYAGNGSSETDENGQVTLPDPNETVTVDLSASVNGASASETVELVPYEQSLDVSAERQDDNTTLVTVTQYDDPVENATVEVEGDDAIAGNYTTDENGTVTLDQPETDGNVTITATADDLSAQTTIELDGYAQLDVTAEQQSDGVFVTVTYGSEAVENATVDVEADGDYAGTGTHTTDENGEVALPLPQENVTVTVTATAENETAETTTDLTVEFVEESGPFGQAVSSFVSALQSAGFDGPPGQAVSDFVTGNNPGNADEAPGQSGDAPGQSGDASGQSDDDGNETDEAPGQSGDAPGQSDDDGNETDDAPGQSGDAPGQSDDDGNETDENDGDADEVNAADEEDEADEDDEDDDDGGDSDADDSGNNGGSDDAPGNSGNAPGQN